MTTEEFTKTVADWAATAKHPRSGRPCTEMIYQPMLELLACLRADGDQQMLQWTAAGAGKRLMGIVHHTDAEREWAYDRTSHIGKLDRAWDEATARGCTVVDMKKDWKRIYPFDK